MVKLVDVLTISEAAKEWGKDASTLRYLCLSGKFVITEARKTSEGPWLITRQGMKRVYGETPEKS